MSINIIFNQPKFAANIGTIMRSAELFGADKVIVVSTDDNLYHATDTAKSYARIGYTAHSFDKALNMVRGSTLIAVEMGENATSLHTFAHPNDVTYIFGSEDKGLSDAELSRCNQQIVIPTEKPWSLNVAQAATAVLWDRYAQYLTLSLKH